MIILNIKNRGSGYGDGSGSGSGDILESKISLALDAKIKKDIQIWK